MLKTFFVLHSLFASATTTATFAPTQALVLRRTFAQAHVLAPSMAAMVSVSYTLSTDAAPKCSDLEQPKHMPGINELFDAESLVAQLRALGATQPSEVTFSIPHGDPPDAHILNGAPVNDVNAAILSAELSALRPHTAALPWTFRAHVKCTSTRLRHSVSHTAETQTPSCKRKRQ